MRHAVQYTFRCFLLLTSSVSDRSGRVCRGVARIFEWGGGPIVGRVVNLPQNTLKIGKNTGFWPLHSRIWGVEIHGFQKCGGPDPPPPPTPPSATPLRVCHSFLARNSRFNDALKNMSKIHSVLVSDDWMCTFRWSGQHCFEMIWLTYTRANQYQS